MVKEVEQHEQQPITHQLPDDYVEDLKIHPIPSKFEDSIILQSNKQEEKEPTFGNVSVTNSTDVHFGNKTFYQGPVTIHNVVYANGEKVQEEELGKFSPKPIVLKEFRPKEGEKYGTDNPGFDEFVTPAVINSYKENSDEVVDLGTASSVSNGFNTKKLLLQYKLCINSIIIFFVSITLLLLIVVLLSKIPDFNSTKPNFNFSIDGEEDHNTPIKEPIDPATSLTPSKLKIVTRLEWLAQPPSHPSSPLKKPVPYVIISHTATENCTSQAQCVFQVRYIQMFHMESRGWFDIGYNFLVGGDGEVYFGRGWDKVGTHTFSYNNISIGIAFIGTYNDDIPPKYQLNACKQLIERGVQLGYIQKNYVLLGARQLQQTKSPGDALFEEIKKWPHWVLKPEIDFQGSAT